MSAVVRKTLYFVGNPNKVTRVHIVCEEGVEFDVVSDCPDYPSVSWEIDLDTAPVDIQLQVEGINDLYERNYPGSPPCKAWVAGSISEDEGVLFTVKTSHGNRRGGIIIVPKVIKIEVLE